MNFDDIIKTAIIEYMKSHNEDAGKLSDFLNKFEEAGKSFYDLPQNIKDELGQIIEKILALNGIIITNLFNK